MLCETVAMFCSEETFDLFSIVQVAEVRRFLLLLKASTTRAPPSQSAGGDTNATPSLMLSSLYAADVIARNTNRCQGLTSRQREPLLCLPLSPFQFPCRHNNSPLYFRFRRGCHGSSTCSACEQWRANDVRPVCL